MQEWKECELYYLSNNHIFYNFVWYNIYTLHLPLDINIW